MAIVRSDSPPTPESDNAPTGNGGDESATAHDSSNARPSASGLPSVDSLPEGYVVGNYAIERVIDAGGGGVVYAVRHMVLDRRAALKTLREGIASSPSMVARFVREATTVNKIQHPNIVDIYEFGEIRPGRPYYVMEFLDGVDLRKILKEKGRLTPQEALPIFEQVCEAVQASHDAGIIHRDIKASNVVIVAGREAHGVKLVDFGIAKPMGESTEQGLTEPGMIVGSAHNMAPEQVRGDALDARTDVYALGVLVFQMLTGRRPFEGDAATITLNHLHTPAPRPSAYASVPRAIDALVLRCMEKEPEARFPSVSALLDAFRSAVAHREAVASEPLDWGVAIYFEVGTSGEGEMDDEMLLDVDNVLDMVEQGFASSAFAFPFRASNAILCVRIVEDEVGAERERRHSERILGEWRAALTARADRHPAVQVSASLLVGQARCRRGARGVEVVGGPLLDFKGWKDRNRVWTT
jgi:serine/threonine-protein kinase